ncbi:reactive intermediate/imine deaminase [Amycolatopsis echigonensis]|uniref:Reactive intermediate/imine deaminase n=1 Tax=Amycolatopsis echigonensis TaxID=2576905 RepID=A0A2N3WDA1_9PSEU|nr:RidA family protein [Amycolatopsis niigatensis]PKV91864.1 reactive intermediate/imine deaminase [Amycolatopsis niigatensis]
MSDIVLRDSPELSAPGGHYSHTAEVGGMAFISGQLPVTRDGARLVSEPFSVQAQQVLANVDACLAAAGTSRDRLVSVTVYVTDMGGWPEFDRIYRSWLGDHRPARAVAGASTLHFGAKVEVQAIAAV